MEREPMETILRAVAPIDSARAVTHVADERVMDVLQVTTHLVEPPCLRPRLHEGAAIDRRAPHHTKRRHRRDARRALRARDGVVDEAFVRRPAAHQRPIDLLHVACFKEPAELRSRLPIPSEDKRPAGAPVEPMHGEHMAPPERIAHPEQRHIIVIVPAPMHEQTRRLVHDHEVLIDEEELSRVHA